MAQETLPVYQQYLLDGKFLINPAFYGETDDFVLHGTYQKQFSKFDESPNVQTIGLHANVVDRLAAGVSFFRDHNGPISANGISAGASYFIPLSDDGDREDQFSFGTSANFYNMNIDYTMLNYTQPDPVLGENKDNVGSQQLSLSPIIKGKIDRFTFGAAYNLGLSDIQSYGGNSFMLSIGYNFENFINSRGFRY